MKRDGSLLEKVPKKYLDYEVYLSAVKSYGLSIG
jgi:hypothetical protein